jgi:hypothetical protein
MRARCTLQLLSWNTSTVLKKLGLRERLNPSGVLKSANSIATEFAAAAAANSSGSDNTSVYCGGTNKRAHSLLRYMNQVCYRALCTLTQYFCCPHDACTVTARARSSMC